MDSRKRLLQLRALSFGPSLEILHFYFEVKALQVSHNGDFTSFLNDSGNKHILFHEYISTVSCCECSKRSLAWPNKKGCLNKKQFLSMYEETSLCKTNHEIKSEKDNSKIIQNCLCKYTAKPSAEICALDITLISVILKQCFMPGSIPGYPKWLNDIKDIRNYVAHNGSGEIEESEFEVKWKTLEAAILGYAGIIGTSVEKKFRREINELKEKSNADLLRCIQAQLQEATISIIQDCVKTSENELEKSLETKTAELKDHFTAEQSRLAEQHAGQNNNLHRKVYKKLTNVDKKLTKVEKKQDKGIGEMTETIRNLEARIVVLEKTIGLATPSNGQYLEREGQQIRMDIELKSTELDETNTIERLMSTKDNSSENEFKLENAQQKCILLNMSSNSKLFLDEESLHTAIRSLIERVIVAGEIDTTQKTTMDVSLTLTSAISNEQRSVAYLMLSKYGVVYQHNSDLYVVPPVDDCLEIDIEHLDLLDLSDIPELTTETKELKIRKDIELKSTELYKIKTIAPLISTNDNNSRNEFKLENATQKCILLNMSSNYKLFEDEESLHTAMRSLIDRVVVAGEIDTTQKTKIEVILTFTSGISNEQRRIAYLMLSKYGVVYQRNSDLEVEIPVVDCLEFDNKNHNETESSHIEVFNTEINEIDVESCTDQSLLETKPISLYDIKKETLECTPENQERSEEFASEQELEAGTKAKKNHANRHDSVFMEECDSDGEVFYSTWDTFRNIKTSDVMESTKNVDSEDYEMSSEVKNNEDNDVGYYLPPEFLQRSPSHITIRNLTFSKTRLNTYQNLQKEFNEAKKNKKSFLNSQICTTSQSNASEGLHTETIATRVSSSHEINIIFDGMTELDMARSDNLQVTAAMKEHDTKIKKVKLIDQADFDVNELCDNAREKDPYINEFGVCMECVKAIEVKFRDEIKPGDHITFPGMVFDDHAIVVKVNEDKDPSKIIIELVRPEKTVFEWLNPFSDTPRLERASIIINLKKKKVMIYKYSRRMKTFEPLDIVKRATSGLNAYFDQFKSSRFQNNSEHFATWCVTGRNLRLQVRRVSTEFRVLLQSRLYGISDAFLRNEREYENNMLCEYCYYRNRELLKIEKTTIFHADQVNAGDIITYKYYFLWHSAVVLEILNKTDTYVKCEIAHYAFIGLFRTREIRKETLCIPLNGTVFQTMFPMNFNVYTPEEVVERARSRIGEQMFNIFSNNSTAFVKWCKLKY